MSRLLPSTLNRPPARTADGPVAPRMWPRWMLLAAFAFLALESLLLAVALQGRWLILIAPGMVCGFKALDTWRELRRVER